MRYDRGNRRDSYGGSRQSFSPVKVGDELDVAIEAVGEKGDGIAKKDGFVLFVPSTKQGDKVRIRVTRVLQKVGFAEVIGEGSSESAQEQGTEQKESSEEPSEETDSGEGYSEPQDSEDFGEEKED